MFDFFEYTFFNHALIAIVIISIATAIIGTYIVTRRLVFVAGGITHTSFGGLGLGYWLGISPSLMATIFAIAGALTARYLHRNTPIRNDSAIGVIWATGMALGIIFIFLTNGYVPELNTFLFGNVLTISTADLYIAAIFTAILAFLFLLAKKLIIAIAFDYDFAITRHLPAKSVDIALTIAMAATIVLSIRMIGIMLLMSLVSLPQICAERFTRNYSSMMWLAAAISLIGGCGGLIISWHLSVPASACIVLTLAFITFLSFILRRAIH